MSYVSLGDLAQTFHMRRQNSILKSQISQLTQELSTGRVSDTAAAVSGDFTPLAGIERAATTLQSYKITTGEASLAAEGMQTALLAIQETSTQLGPTLLTASNTGQPSILNSAAIDAREKLDGVISRFNIQIADRSLFSGAALDQPALADGDTILADVMTAISELTTADTISATIDTWFDTGGGFETIGYLGSDDPPSAFQIAPGEQAQITVTAADPAVRDILKGFVLASVIAEGALAGDETETFNLMGKAGETMLTAQGELAVLQSRVGSVEARVEAAKISNASEGAALDLARSDLLGVDPYETATKLEDTQTQLETLYALTARLSRLSLVDFLR